MTPPEAKFLDDGSDVLSLIVEDVPAAVEPAKGDDCYTSCIPILLFTLLHLLIFKTVSNLVCRSLVVASSVSIGILWKKQHGDIEVWARHDWMVHIAFLAFVALIF